MVKKLELVRSPKDEALLTSEMRNEAGLLLRSYAKRGTVERSVEGVSLARMMVRTGNGLLSEPEKA